MKPYAIGIDIGGTKIAAGLVDRSGTILHRYHTQAHSEQQPAVVIDAVVKAYESLMDGSQADPAAVAAVGLGFGGNVNSRTGVVMVSSNLPAWNQTPLRDIVAERIGQPVVLENDTNMAALGEYHYGAGRGTGSMGYVTFSTGYGLGLILNGQLYGGHTGTAGELGHAVIDIGGPPCSCGKNGCIMAYASGVGISRMAYENIEAGAETLLQPLPDGRRISGQAIADAANQGDRVAREILKTAGYYAGVGVSIAIQILNPEAIVIGGGLTRIGPLVMIEIERGMREHTQPQMLATTRLIPWQLGDDLGIVGAAAKVFAGT